MKKEMSMKKVYTQKLIFYISVIGLPLIQFLVFWVYVNFNSLTLSFREFTIVNGELTSQFVGLKYMINAYQTLFTDPLFTYYCLRNSFVFYGISVLSGTIFSLCFSYYIYKRRKFSNFFKAILYLPAVTSGMVLTIIFKYFFAMGIPSAVKLIAGINILGWTDNSSIEYLMVVLYNFFFSFGSNMLIYVGTMASISDSCIEAAQIDGVNAYQEFWYIVIPSIFKTLSLFIVTNIMVIFNGNGGIFNFFGQNASEKLYTFGYYLYIELLSAQGNVIYFPELAALGLALTSFAIPIMFTLRWLFEKYGPTES